MKAVKIILAVIAGLIVLLAAAAAFVAMRFDPNQYKSELAALVKEKTGRTLSVDGKLGLSLFPTLGVSAGAMRLSERDGSTAFASLKEAKLSLALMPLLSRQFVVDRVVLTGVEASVVKGRDGKTNIADLTGGDQSAAEQKQPGAAAMKLDIAGVELGVDRLLWRDEREARQWLLSGLSVKTGRLADDVPGKLSLSGRLEGPDARAGLELAADYRFNLAGQQLALTALDVKLSGDLGGMQGVKLGVQGQLDADWGKELVKGALAVKIDDSTLKAKFDVQGFSPAAIQFDADLDRLDTARYAGKGGATAAAPAGKSGPATGSKAPDKPIDLEGLKGLNLKGQLRIGQLVASGLKADKVELGLRAAGGRVDVQPMTASLYGGTLSGSAGIDANTYRFTARPQLQGINIGPLLKDLANKDLLEGRGKVVLDVQTTGRTVPDLKKALAGSASIALNDGAIKGINLAEALRKAKAAIGSQSAQEQTASGGDKTDFTEMTASFSISKGVAHNEDLSAKSPFIRIGGAGDLDIGEGRMNYLAKAAIVNTAAGQGGKDAGSLAGLTVPVRISGPFDALAYRVEIGSMVSDSVKQQVQEKVKGQVQDRLKGLFAR